MLFKNPTWQFDSVEELQQRQRQNNTSLGVVTPKSISRIRVVKRKRQELSSFEDKLDGIRRTLEAKKAQLRLFEDAREAIPAEMKSLEFVDRRIAVDWTCNDSACRGHSMQVLHWEIAELHRREGDEKAVAKMGQICDLTQYALKFFLGNLFLHPSSFLIVGLWYPKRSRGRLF